MANMQRMGGIGSGIMQGLQFMRQREADARQDQSLENQNQQLQMNRQIHDERMGALNRENEERQRVETLGAMNTNIHNIYSDLPEYAREQLYIDKALAVGQLKPAELAAANEKVKGLRKAASPEAYDALMRGDIKPAQTLLKSRGIDLRPDNKTPDSYLVLLPGSTTPQAFTRQGMLQLDAMSGAYEREKARAEAELKARKTDAEIRNLESRTNLNDRLPQERGAGAGGSGRGAGGKEPKPFGLDINDIEKFAPLDPATGKPDPQKVISIASNAESIFNLNPAIREKSPYAAYQIAAAIEKGDIKPEMVWDQATNSYYKAVKYGSGTARIGHESEADPDAFYANNPAAIKVRINNDRAWLGQYTQSIADPKQRETIGLALRADTPQGAAARNEIIAAYNKVKSSGQPIPLFLRQQYSALQTADRLKSAPPEEQNPTQARTAAPPVDMSIHGKPTYAAYVDASERLDQVKADAAKMSPDRREQYLANRVPELEALVKHHIRYLENHH